MEAVMAVAEKAAGVRVAVVMDEAAAEATGMGKQDEVKGGAKAMVPTEAERAAAKGAAMEGVLVLGGARACRRTK